MIIDKDWTELNFKILTYENSAIGGLLIEMIAGIAILFDKSYSSGANLFTLAGFAVIGFGMWIYSLYKINQLKEKIKFID